MKLINEVKRMQQLAGLVKEDEFQDKVWKIQSKFNYAIDDAWTAFTKAGYEPKVIAKMLKEEFMEAIKDLLQNGVMSEDTSEDTIQVDGMTGMYMTTVGQSKLYSSESTEVGSNFDYFIVNPGEEPRFISVELDEEPESPVKAKYIMKKTGLQDPTVCKAIAADINQELDLM